MTAFDTDVLSQILLGNARLASRAAKIPIQAQYVPIVVAEEIMRGRLNIIRQAETGRAKIEIARAYALFEQTFLDLRRFRLLAYTTEAEALFQQWRAQRIRVATHDLRIAAICITRGATLVSRNRRDFERVPEFVR